MPDDQGKVVLNDAELSRRKILKALTTLGGAVAATGFMQSRWSSPLVDLGVMPAHAQTDSGTLELSGTMSIMQIGPLGSFSALSKDFGASNGGTKSYTAECTYNDALKSLTRANTTCTDYSITNATLVNAPSVSYVSPERAATGTIGIQFATATENSTSFQFCTRISSNGRLSNRMCGTKTDPI